MRGGDDILIYPIKMHAFFRQKGPNNLVWNIVISEKLYNLNMELKPS